MPDPARQYTSEEIANGTNRLNNITDLSARADHDIGAVLEYPETTPDNSKLAHVFKIDPNVFRDPFRNIQYSIHITGGAEKLRCRLLSTTDQDGIETFALCYKTRGNCCGIKLCNFSENQPGGFPSHTFVSPTTAFLSFPLPTPYDSKREVFEKTLALFCSIKVDGCPFNNGEEHGVATSSDPHAADFFTEPGPTPLESGSNIDPIEEELVGRLSSVGTGSVAGAGAEDGDLGVTEGDSDSDVDAEGEVEVDERLLYRPSRSHRKVTCTGTITLRFGKVTQKPYLCCDKLREGPGHFLFTNLHEFNIQYLQALLANNTTVIDEVEQDACRQGYGPRAPCTYTTEHRRVGDFCDRWHRDDAGFLRPGRLTQSVDCESFFETFTPYDLQAFPYVVIITSKPHNHPPPRQSKTPPIYVDIIRTLLIDQDWRLADATPRRLVLNKAFVTKLKSLLGSEASPREPTLVDLHPSLANQQKVGYIIKRTKEIQFVAGTDWEGAILLAEDHAKQRCPEDQYIRCIEEFQTTSSETARLIVCMFPAQSRLLSRARWISCDTSYKRVKRFREFGLEGWNEVTRCSESYCRVFITSESAEAHRFLFHKISSIVSVDTGLPLQFRYVDGRGIEVITADEGKGQALGIALFLRDRCRNNAGFDFAEPTRRFSDLAPYDHLARIYRLCTVHFQRNIRKIEGRLSPEVVAAMYSLASSHPLADLEGTLRTIQAGGREAQNWLHDKQVSAPFALPALYHPLSKIPLEQWLAARSTTNGIEQTHHNYNIDGINLTLLGGIMQGFQYDARAISRHDLFTSTLIYPHYTSSSHFNRAQTALRRQAKSSQKRRATQPTVEEDPTLRSPAKKRQSKKK